MPLITDFNKSWNSVLSGIRTGMTASKKQVEAKKPWVLSTDTLMHEDVKPPGQNLLPVVPENLSSRSSLVAVSINGCPENNSPVEGTSVGMVEHYMG